MYKGNFGPQFPFNDTRIYTTLKNRFFSNECKCQYYIYHFNRWMWWIKGMPASPIGLHTIWLWFLGYVPEAGGTSNFWIIWTWRWLGLHWLQWRQIYGRYNMTLFYLIFHMGCFPRSFWRTYEFPMSGTVFKIQQGACAELSVIFVVIIHAPLLILFSSFDYVLAHVY